MGNNQRVAIFIVIGVFMVSVFGSAILILSGGGTNSHDNTSDADLAAQAKALEGLQAEQDRLNQQAATCTSLPKTTSPGSKTVPAYDLPTADITVLDSVDLTVGTGKVAKAGDCVVAYYHGTLPDGTVFDSAYERGIPNRFSLLQVIKGWQDGVPGMKEGGVRVLYIPSEESYGDAGSPPLIGPNQDLVFVIELVEVVGT